VAARSARADELHHLGDAGDHPAWSESFGLDFAAADGEVAGYLIVTLWPSEGRAWCWACVTGVGRTVVAIDEPDAPLPRRDALELRASGLWVDVECETPFDHVSVGVEAFGIAFEDPRDALRSGRGERTPVGFDLEWETAGDVGRRGDACYAIDCAVSGEVLVGDERFDLDVAGRRWHRWGTDEWWTPRADAPADGAGATLAIAFVDIPRQPRNVVLRSTLRAVREGARWTHGIDVADA
jgi:hypothetical protein